MEAQLDRIGAGNAPRRTSDPFGNVRVSPGEAPLLREILIALHETERVGWKKIKQFLGHEDRMEAPRWREGDWRAVGFNRPEAAAVVSRLHPEAMERSRQWREQRGIRVVTFLDPEYPASLACIAEPPWVLYALGDWSLTARHAVAVVGTRMATAYGRKVAEGLGAAFAEAGLAVVSGMARGIDAAAHVGALRAAGATIAVLGTPIDRPYPPEHRALYREIAARGLVLSEVSPGSTAHKGNFRWRNRIIAGLALATVVVEAGESSGALNTASWAAQYSRDVFAVPGPVTSPASRGVLRLAADPEKKVKLCIDAGDVLREYPFLPRRDAAREDAAASPSRRERLRAAPVPLAGTGGDPDPEETLILNLLSDAPRTIDELAAAADLPVGRLHAVLLRLQLCGRIVEHPGQRYALAWTGAEEPARGNYSDDGT